MDKPNIYRVDNCIIIEYPKETSLDSFLFVIQEVEKIENKISFKLNRLHDMRKMQKTDTDYNKMVKIASTRKMNLAKLSGTKAAFAVSKELHFGLTRMYQQMMIDVDHQVNAFYDIDKARRWLKQ